MDCKNCSWRAWIYASPFYSLSAMTKPIAIIERSLEKREKKVLSILKKQKVQALILVPEVAMLQRYAQSGATIYHAGLKQSEKKDIWNKVQTGEIQTVIGTQKGLFLPFQNLKTIVIEEEQYESHKLWDQYPRLHTARAAEKLAQVWKAQLLYASSYPSIRLRFMIENKECKADTNNPIRIETEIIPFSFEDRKWKRALPNDAGTKIRYWARQGKKVLVLYNKKDNEKVKEALYFHLSKKAKENIHLGTASLLTGAANEQYDRVVWIAPEFTMKAVDHRSTERARILAARLQDSTPRHPVTMVTRSTDLAKHVFEISDTLWYDKVLKERRLLHLPPYTDIVRLTVRDKDTKKALERAETVAGTLEDILKKIPNAAVLGPFQEKGPKKSKLTEYHILVSGELEKTAEGYKNLPIDLADVDPKRIV